jgi:hypothetical protein
MEWKMNKGIPTIFLSRYQVADECCGQVSVHPKKYEAFEAAKRHAKVCGKPVQVYDLLWKKSPIWEFRETENTSSQQTKFIKEKAK